MKLIVVGATGFVGTEVIRQAVLNPEITSVVALARREVTLPEDVSQALNDPKKFKTVVCQDFERYPENLKKEFADADCCIWYV